MSNKRPTASSLNVLHSPVNIANQPWVLSRCERELGIRSDLIVNYDTWLELSADEVLSEYGNRNFKSVLKRSFSGLRAPLNYNVLHYYFGRSLLSWDDWSGIKFPFLDLKLAHALGRRIFMTLQGCDIRIARESNSRNKFTPCQSDKCSFYENCVENVDGERLKLAADILPLCDKVFYLNPELGFYIRNGEFLPYANVDIQSFQFRKERRPGPIRILHAPSDENLKGTPAIKKALEMLRNSYDFEVILVKGKTHTEAVQLYQAADLAIDQIYAGWYGGFAVEMMAMGVPVMCYLRDEDFVHLPATMASQLPILNVRPDHLVDDIGSVLDNIHDIENWSRDSRRFVERWHDPRLIAKAMIEQYIDPHRSVGDDLAKFAM